MWNAESTVVQQLDDRRTAEGSEIDSVHEHSTVLCYSPLLPSYVTDTITETVAAVQCAVL
jgi:hypothetical protein